MASPKLVLHTRDLTDDFFDDTRMLGIMCPVKDYQFCWQLNTMLGIDFRNNKELEIELRRKKRNYFFAVYDFPEPAGSLCHYLYKNQFDGEYLLPEFKHLDYLWLLKGDVVSETLMQTLQAGIRLISSVQLVVELSVDKIVNKENLVF